METGKQARMREYEMTLGRNNFQFLEIFAIIQPRRYTTMLLLTLECKNFFLFDNLSIDFTYPRKLNYDITKNDAIFEGSKIKVRKHIIIMGANAAGKTTLGRLLCLIYNYLIGRDGGSAEDLCRSINHPDRPASFTVEFSIRKTAYRLTAVFDKKGLAEETLVQASVSSDDNMTALRLKLDAASPLYYRRDDHPANLLPGFRSYLINIPENEQQKLCFQKNILFWFALSAFRHEAIDRTGLPHIDISLISKILPILDNSVEKIIPLVPETPQDTTPEISAVGDTVIGYNPKPKSYTIRFKNGQEQTVPDGNLSQIQSERLSQGTAEAVSFSTILSYLKNADHNTVFVDECLTHMHSELEKYLIWLSFLIKKEDSQLFFTTHNTEICDLRLPTHSFLFLKREKNGFNTALWANSRLIKNDRNFRNYYENDYFDVLPDYSDLISLLDSDGGNRDE